MAEGYTLGAMARGRTRDGLADSTSKHYLE